MFWFGVKKKIPGDVTAEVGAPGAGAPPRHTTHKHSSDLGSLCPLRSCCMFRFRRGDCCCCFPRSTSVHLLSSFFFGAFVFSFSLSPALASSFFRFVSAIYELASAPSRGKAIPLLPQRVSLSCVNFESAPRRVHRRVPTAPTGPPTYVALNSNLLTVVGFLSSTPETRLLFWRQSRSLSLSLSLSESLAFSLSRPNLRALASLFGHTAVATLPVCALSVFGARRTVLPSPTPTCLPNPTPTPSSEGFWAGRLDHLCMYLYTVSLVHEFEA